MPKVSGRIVEKDTGLPVAGITFRMFPMTLEFIFEVFPIHGFRGEYPPEFQTKTNQEGYFELNVPPATFYLLKMKSAEGYMGQLSFPGMWITVNTKDVDMGVFEVTKFQNTLKKMFEPK